MPHSCCLARLHPDQGSNLTTDSDLSDAGCPGSGGILLGSSCEPGHRCSIHEGRKQQQNSPPATRRLGLRRVKRPSERPPPAISPVNLRTSASGAPSASTALEPRSWLDVCLTIPAPSPVCGHRPALRSRSMRRTGLLTSTSGTRRRSSYPTSQGKTSSAGSRRQSLALPLVAPLTGSCQVAPELEANPRVQRTRRPSRLPV